MEESAAEIVTMMANYVELLQVVERTVLTFLPISNQCSHWCTQMNSEVAIMLLTFYTAMLKSLGIVRKQLTLISF